MRLSPRPSLVMLTSSWVSQVKWQVGVAQVAQVWVNRYLAQVRVNTCFSLCLLLQSYAEQVEVKLGPAAHLISPRPSPPSPYLGQAYLQQARLGSHFAPMAPTLAPHGVTASPPPQHQPIGMHSSFMPQVSVFVRVRPTSVGAPRAYSRQNLDAQSWRCESDTY